MITKEQAAHIRTTVRAICGKDNVRIWVNKYKTMTTVKVLPYRFASFDQVEQTLREAYPAQVILQRYLGGGRGGRYALMVYFFNDPNAPDNLQLLEDQQYIHLQGAGKYDHIIAYT